MAKTIEEIKKIYNDLCKFQNPESAINHVLFETNQSQKFIELINQHHFYNDKQVLNKIKHQLDNHQYTSIDDLRDALKFTDSRKWHYMPNDYTISDYYQGSDSDYYDNGIDDCKQAIREYIQQIERSR